MKQFSWGGDSRAGSSLVSVLVGAGASMAVLAGVTTMIQYSQKAGQGVQGLSEFGMLVDSLRTLVASPTTCSSAFVDATGNPVVLPKPTATPGTVVEAAKVLLAGSPLIEKDEKLQSVTVSKIELTRLKDDPSLVALRLVAQKKAGSLGKQELEQSKPIFIRASFDDSSGKITSCSAGSDPAAGALGGTGQSGVNLQVFNSSGTFTVPAGVTRILVEVWGGGGGGCPGAGGAGGGGGFASSSVAVSPGMVFSVVVGAGGNTGSPWNGSSCPGATSGGESAFKGEGIEVKATGGIKGAAGGGRGGMGSGGQITLKGQDGEDLYASFSGRYIAKGGDSPRGGSGGTSWGAGFGEAGYGGNNATSQGYHAGSAPGGGGAANFNGGSGPGAPGAVHIRW